MVLNLNNQDQLSEKAFLNRVQMFIAMLFFVVNTPCKMLFMRRITHLWYIFFCSMLLLSCKKASKEKAESILKSKPEPPTQQIFGVNMVQKDSGRIVSVLKTHQIDDYQTGDSIYTLFPKGLKMTFYKKNVKNPGSLNAKWVRHLKKQDLYEARNNVVIVSPEVDSVKTDTLFWNRSERRFYSRASTYMRRKDGLWYLAKQGFTASEDLTTYELFNNKGQLIVKE